MVKTISIEIIKELREKSGAGVMDVKRALEESGGDEKKAMDWIRKKGLAKAKKRSDKDASEGLIASYVHQNGKIASFVELKCETDFVARTDDFASLGREIAMQVTSMEPTDVKALLSQTYIRDSSKSIQDLIAETVAKTGEKIEIGRFLRWELGEK